MGSLRCGCAGSIPARGEWRLAPDASIGRRYRGYFGIGRDSELLVRDPEFGGDIDQVGKGSSTHLPHHAATMCFHRDLADSEPAADLLVHKSGDHQRHDLSLAAT